VKNAKHIVCCNVDVAVIGGGPAGVCAALAVAQNGCKVVLVTDRPVLGGNSSSEIRVWTRGAVGSGNLMAEEMGIWGRLKLENLYRNFDANPVFWDDVLLDAVLQQPNLQLELNTEIDEVKLAGHCIKKVAGTQQGSEKRFEITAKYFIDATGDAVIGQLAGVSQVDDSVSNSTMGNSILFNTCKEDHPIKYVAPHYAYNLQQIESILGHGGRVISENMGGSDCWWFEYGGLQDTIEDSQDIALELRRMALGVWNYIKNSGHYNADNYTLEWIGSIPGKRESRRMKTEYVLTEQDIIQNKRFPDGAFYGGWYIDSHPSGGFADTEEDNCKQRPVQVYQIPLRCLYQRTVPNLLFAGRNIGIERGAFFSSRVMNTCALAGQAAGTLAATCARQNKVPCDLMQTEVTDVIHQLQQDDMFIPDVPFYVPGDSARNANITASSCLSTNKNKQNGKLMPLDHGGYVVFPGVCGKVEVKVFSESTQQLYGTMSSAMLPNHYDEDTMGTPIVWQLEAGEQTISVDVPKQSVGKFVMLQIQPAQGVKIFLANVEHTGIICGEQGSPEINEPIICYKNSSERIYDTSNLSNGWNRPWGQPNQWCADPDDENPWLLFTWEKAIEINHIKFFLDPDLSMELPSSRASHSQYQQQAAELAKTLVSDDVALDYFENNGMPPVTKSAANTDEVKNNAYLQGFMKATSTARMEETARMTNASEIKSVITEELQFALLGQKTAEQAVADMASRLEAL
jgi:ribulose 1,5-bisphosphate synthetase/thiazole synthase